MAEIPTVDQVAKENFEHWSVEDAKLLAIARSHTTWAERNR